MAEGKKRERPKKGEKPIKAGRPKKPEVEVMGMEEGGIEEAVAWINEKIRSNVHGTYLEIGNYVFEQFFGGDLDQVKSFNPYKESSFRKLSERNDLLLSKSSLYRAVQVAIQEKFLLPTVSELKQLTFNHQVALLPLKSNRIKEELVRRAVEDSLSSIELEKLVKEAREGEPRSAAGRPMLPGFLKSIRKAYNVFGKDGALEGLTRETLSGLKKDEAIAIREKTKQILSAVSQINEALTEVIEAEEERPE